MLADQKVRIAGSRRLLLSRSDYVDELCWMFGRLRGSSGVVASPRSMGRGAQRRQRWSFDDGHPREKFESTVHDAELMPSLFACLPLSHMPWSRRSMFVLSDPLWQTIGDNIRRQCCCGVNRSPVASSDRLLTVPRDSIVVVQVRVNDRSKEPSSQG